MTRRQGEGALSDAIREALAYEPGLLLMRNSAAVVRLGGRVYHGGLGNGSADLVGVLKVPVSLAIGRDVGLFVAIEVKLPGKVPTPERIAKLQAAMSGRGDLVCADDRRDLAQWDWLAAIRERGGFACYVDSVQAARAAIVRARRGERQ